MAPGEKTFPRAVIWKDDLDDGEWSGWMVYLTYGPLREADYIGEYNNWLWALVEAIAAVKKARSLVCQRP